MCRKQHSTLDSFLYSLLHRRRGDPAGDCPSSTIPYLLPPHRSLAPSRVLPLVRPHNQPRRTAQSSSTNSLLSRYLGAIPAPLQVVQTILASPEQLTQTAVWSSPLPNIIVVSPVPSQKRHTVSPVPSHTKHGWVLGLASELAVALE